MIKTNSNLNELKKAATNLIGMDKIPAGKYQLAEIIARGIGDTFEARESDEWEIDEYLRDRALNFWFYPSMNLEELVPKLTDEIANNWEIKRGDDRMLSTCLAAVLIYHPHNLSVTLGELLKSDPTTQNLATLEGFDITKINQILVQHNARPLSVN
ncbi:hypothetical protein I6H67_00915 [Pediococcus pentosaceus]|uniref:hypothetical protein n=1 Tax=Pediococcus pentosaceus TaxID=1255 RepID=UPI0018E1C4FF|nr:hypothetical protein [Pediococcus pentosaceus]MBF7104557.1 hypothetical protein [Pediococcus pentosaceus]QQC61470.1 hypothetical protein I6H67_00915 [Pediococcus pentosaceus]